MTATITLKRATAKEPSLEKLAKSKARGTNGHSGREVLGDWYDERLRKNLGELLDEGPDVLLRIQPDDRKLAGELIAKKGELSQLDRSAAELVLARGNVARNEAAGPPTAEAVPGKPETKPAKRETKASAGETLGPVVKLKVADLVRHPKNRKVSGEAIDERAASMAEHTQLEPIIVRTLCEGKMAGVKLHSTRYQIISGETRWLAARKLGWEEIDGRIRECTDAEALDLVAIANGQRKDLNPIERAQLIEELCKPIADGGAGLTKDAAATRVGLKDGSSASNLVRLLKLPKVWQERIGAGELPESFGRLILPIIELTPVLDALEKEWKQCDKKINRWDNNAFASRNDLDEAIEDHLNSKCRDVHEEFYVGANKRVTLKLDVTDAAVRKQFGIVDVQRPTGPKGSLELVPYATNVKAFDEYKRQYREQLANAKAEKAGRDKSKPKREPTAAEKKANAAKQAEQLKHRRAVWRHEWLKSLVAERLEDQDWQGTKLLCWMITHFQNWIVHRGGQWPAKMNKALRDAGGRGEGWSAVDSTELTTFSVPVMRDHRKSQRSYQLDEVLRNFLRSVLLDDDRDSHHPVIPHAVLDGLAADYGIDLAAEWDKLQVDPKGRERLERFFLLHQTQQLRDLAWELGKHTGETATRAGISKMLLASVGPTFSNRFKLPSCIKPLGVPGKAKAKKRK